MKLLITLLATLAISIQSYSQVALKFCASVEQSGHCVFDNTKFIISPDSTGQKVQMELTSSQIPIGVANIVFKIYGVQANGDEKFLDMKTQAIQSDWYVAWTPFRFPEPGKYTVKVFGPDEKLICQKTMELYAFK
jgi:hypothetical protein